jgi:hypothetical protein
MVQLDLRKTENIGCVIMFIAAVLRIAETLYFGSNWLPRSRSESICDIIVFTVFGSGGGIYMFANVIRTKEALKNIKSER